MSVTNAQWLAMDSELRTAAGLIAQGLAAVQAISGANDFYHFPLLLLANGFERVCKCALAFQHLVAAGCFPSKKDFKDYGHDLSALVSEVVSKCFDANYGKRLAAARDRDFLLNDTQFRKFLGCLSNFGDRGRYHDLDVVGGQPGTDMSPTDTWQKLELATKAGQQWKKSEDWGTHPYGEITKEIVVSLETFARSLARLFTVGPLSSKAKQWSDPVKAFACLADGDRGTTDYHCPT